MFQQKRIYLDYAASHPVRRSAQRAFVQALSANGNPSAPHTEGREARTVLEEARTSIARLCGAKKEQVIFTGNATEANNLAITGYIEGLVQKGARIEDLHILYMAGAHASVVKTIEVLVARGLRADVLPLTEGRLEEKTLLERLRPETCLVTLEAIMSETGLRIDTRMVQVVLKREHARAIVHVDASQVPLVESFERTRLGADLMTLDAQKVGGVRGIGALITTPSISLVPQMHGGGQERDLRSGTEAPALARAFATALHEAHKERAVFVARAELIRKMLVAKLPSFVEVNEGKEQAPHILNISLVGKDTDYLVALLDEAGFAVSTRSSCETDAEHGSRAVLELTGAHERAKATLRMSWGNDVRVHDIEKFSRALARAIAFLDQHTLKRYTTG